MLWTLLSPSLKGEHSWIWTPCGKFWMTLYPPTQGKLLAALRFCCEVSRALGPAQHCFIMTVLSYEIQSLPGIQTTLPEKLKLSPLDGRRNTLQRTRKKWGVKKKKIPSSLQYDIPKPTVSISYAKIMFFYFAFLLLLLPITNPKVNS